MIKVAVIAVTEDNKIRFIFYCEYPSDLEWVRSICNIVPQEKEL